jgi:hypothetical protein
MQLHLEEGMNTKMEYWVEVNHSDICSMCRDGVPGCASGKPGKRIRTAQFMYFMEAIDYAQECQRRSVPVWLRKPIYVGNDRTKSEYSLYPVRDSKPAGLLQTPVMLDGQPGVSL